MRPKKHETTGSGDLFRARLDQIINMRHELVQLAGKIDWEFIDGEIAPLYSDGGRPGIATQFVIGLFFLKHIYGLSDEGVCERWVYDPYFQHFTGEEFFQHEFPHERSNLSHWRKRLGGKLELLLAESLRGGARERGAADEGFGAGHGRYHRAAQGHHLPNRCEAFARRDQGGNPTGQEARRAAAAIVCAHRHMRQHAPLAPVQPYPVHPPPAPNAALLRQHAGDMVLLPLRTSHGRGV
jgi:IS5 family transposase